MTRILIISILLLLPFRLFSQKKTYKNPIGDSIFMADPFVLYHQGVYYLYGTTSANKGFEYYISKNLVEWKRGGFAYKRTNNSWGQSSFWAPEVIFRNNKFYMLYSSKGKTMFGSGLRLCLAVSDTPTGPFVDIQAPLFDLGFSCIDGHIFIDDDNTPYLYYEKVGSVGEFWNKKGYLWGQIFGVKLSNNLLKLQHEPTLCLYPDQEWEGINSLWARSNEGMTVIKHNGTYYMTYSGNHYKDPNYGVGYAVSSKPLGMWEKSEDNPILKNDLNKGVSGPGHNCIVQSPDMSEWFMVYHSHAYPEEPSHLRILNIDRLIFDKDGTLKIKGPTRIPQDYPSF